MPKYIRALEDRITLTEQLAIERSSVERLSVQVLNLQSEVQLLLTRQAMLVPAATAEKPVKREIEVIEVLDYTPVVSVAQTPQRVKESAQRSHPVPVSLRIPPITHVTKAVALESKPAIEYCEVINLDDDDEDVDEEEEDEEDGEQEEPLKVAEIEPDNIRSSHPTDTEKRKRRKQTCSESGCSKTFRSEKLLAQHFAEFHADANVVFQDGVTDGKIEEMLVCLLVSPVVVLKALGLTNLQSTKTTSQ
ncbi:hypothetical protein HDU81_000262 [Chytriomyces hyalinus]|nr:hypothetical protein HDU81_000262 [Chytriomyces hyalinus]